MPGGVGLWAVRELLLLFNLLGLGYREFTTTKHLKKREKPE